MKLRNNTDAWEKYRLCADQYMKEVAEAKAKYFSVDLLSILKSNPNKFWRLLSPKSSSNQIELVDSGGQPINSEDCASVLNDYFASTFNPANSTAVSPSPFSSPRELSPFDINPDGISNLIRNLKSSSSAGCDCITTKLLKNTVHYSSLLLSLIFLQSLELGTVPDEWKKAQIIPIFKSGNRSIPANYRPISLTCICSKLFEHIIASSLMSHLESINFFHPLQHGFRKHFSCDTQLAEFTHDLLNSMDNNLQTDAIFLDFAKAFDRVPHNHLIRKLTSLGIPPNLLSWIKHFLTGRMQFTSANNCQSAFAKVTSGVPQGAGLSPLLFLIYINDLPANIKSNIRLFADDCVIYTVINSPADANKLQRDLDSIASWCNKWLMPLNIDKCKSLSFTRKRAVLANIYSINAVPIASVSCYKYLGVHLTSSLSWITHIDSICSTASRTLGYLRRNLKCASPDVKKLAFITFVRPKLEYASAIWHPSQAYLTTKLESIQNRAARFISSQYSHKTSVTELKHSLSLPTLESRRLITRLCLLHRFYYHPRSRHQLLQSAHRTSSRINHSRPIARINGRTTAFITSFFPNAIALWNALPDDSASCADRETFRAKLNEHFFKPLS